ncbi:hypothetical protein IAT38_003344 [Cryptococcus sp. DSM 104549]
MPSVNYPIIEAELLVAAQNDLGESVMWDSKTQLLHWVDIYRAQLHTLDPVTGNRSIDVYPESQCLTYISPRASQPGFIATLSGALVVLPPATPPTSLNPEPVVRQSLETLDAPEDKKLVEDHVIRFNDGGIDPQGRVLYGSMGVDMSSPVKPGHLWRRETDGSTTKIFDNIGCSNGLGWSPDGRTMYYIDSRTDLVSAYDYSPSGIISNKRDFGLPPPSSTGPPGEAAYDGLCVDGVGNVWVARWRDEMVVGLNPQGEVIAQVKTTGCRSPTIPCFGGKDLSTMYIVSAVSTRGGEGDHSKWPRSGDVFKIECGPGSDLGKVLGPGWKGAERHRAQL